jgi:hypothetical protein
VSYEEVKRGESSTWDQIHGTSFSSQLINGRHDAQHNDIEHNNIQDNDNQQNNS